MPVRAIFLSESAQRDIHLIRGDPQRNTSPVIRDMGLLVTEVLSDGSDHVVPAYEYLARANTDLAIDFNPTFLHTTATDDATNFKNFGIQVNRAAGVVLAENSPGPAPFPSNFLVEIKPRHIGAAVGRPPIDPVTVRVHIHDGVDRIWITPSVLTVRRQPPEPSQPPNPEQFTEFRFAVHARFTDGVVGDITIFHRVTWTPATHFDNRTQTHRDGDFRAGFVKLPTGVTAAGGPIAVTATWIVAGQTLTAPATIQVADPWAPGPTLPRIELLSGPPATWNVGNPADVLNVLFIGAGYQTPALPVFEQITTAIAENFRTDKMTRPFDLLSSSMNLWRVAMAAGAPGLSVRDSVYLKDPTTAVLVPRAERPPTGNEAWTVAHVIYAAGLPLPSYATQFNPAGNTFEKDLRAFWQATLLSPPPNAPTVSKQVMLEWVALANRFFIDQVDNFPPVSISDPPRASGGGGYVLGLHAERGPANLLASFCGALEAAASQTLPAGPGGTNLGVLWSVDRPDFAYDNRDYIVLTTAGIGGANFRRGRGLFLPTDPKFEFKVAPVANGRLQHAPGALPTVPPKATFPEFHRMVAHELSHAFGLEDEYPGDGPSVFTGPEATLDRNANVTSLEGVSVATSPPPAPRAIRSRLIKWNWDRIRKAAVLTGQVTVVGGGFEIPVVAGHQLPFAVGDVVRLRRRRRRIPITATTLPTDASLNLKVSALGASSITVQGAATLANFASYDAGSLVYAPVPGTTNDPADPFLKLIAPRIAKQIDDTGRPLTAEPCNASDVAKLGSNDQVPIIENLSVWDEVLSTFSRRHTLRFVGLYAGGRRDSCGIFHPAGFCMMRNHYDEFAQFCAVCRYVLVEFIDPTKHGDIDRDFDDHYPD